MGKPPDLASSSLSADCHYGISFLFAKDNRPPVYLVNGSLSKDVKGKAISGVSNSPSSAPISCSADKLGVARNSLLVKDVLPPSVNLKGKTIAEGPSKMLFSKVVSHGLVSKGSQPFRASLRPPSAPFLEPDKLPNVPEIVLGPKLRDSMDGEPKLFFTPLEFSKVVEDLQYTIIAKFSSERPPANVFDNFVNSSWGLLLPATVGLLDHRSFSIWLQSLEDFNLAWSQEHNMLDNKRFVLSRWSPDSGKKTDSRFAPIWVRFPLMPLGFENPAFLRELGKTLGNFISFDCRTRKQKFPMQPRICVEMDLSKPLPNRIKLGVGNEEGFWQPIAYDSNTRYCLICNLKGHSNMDCRRNKNPSGQSIPLPEPPLKPRKRGNNTKEVKEWLPEKIDPSGLALNVPAHGNTSADNVVIDNAIVENAMQVSSQKATHKVWVPTGKLAINHMQGEAPLDVNKSSDNNPAPGICDAPSENIIIPVSKDISHMQLQLTSLKKNSGNLDVNVKIQSIIDSLGEMANSYFCSGSLVGSPNSSLVACETTVDLLNLFGTAAPSVALIDFDGEMHSGEAQSLVPNAHLLLKSDFLDDDSKDSDFQEQSGEEDFSSADSKMSSSLVHEDTSLSNVSSPFFNEDGADSDSEEAISMAKRTRGARYKAKNTFC